MHETEATTMVSGRSSSDEVEALEGVVVFPVNDRNLNGEPGDPGRAAVRPAKPAPTTTTLGLSW